MSVHLLRVRTLATFMMVIVSLTGVCFADGTSNTVTEQFMKNPDLPVIVRGDYFKAIEAAFRDFSIELARRAKESPDSSNPELTARLSKIENFDIHVEQGPSVYIIWFRPTMRSHAHVIMGGGVTYTIDRHTFAIIKKVSSK